jgi:hypothetical protein
MKFSEGFKPRRIAGRETISWLTMITRICITSPIISLASCHQPEVPEVYSLSKADILDSQSKMRGVIFRQIGADGPYMDCGTFGGTIGDAGSSWVGEGSKRVSVSWPATPGYYYESTTYMNAKREGFMVVRKISELEAIQSKAEQDANGRHP